MGENSVFPSRRPSRCCCTHHTPDRDDASRDTAQRTQNGVGRASESVQTKHKAQRSANAVANETRRKGKMRFRNEIDTARSLGMVMGSSCMCGGRNEAKKDRNGRRSADTAMCGGSAEQNSRSPASACAASNWDGRLVCRREVGRDLGRLARLGVAVGDILGRCVSKR